MVWQGSSRDVPLPAAVAGAALAAALGAASTWVLLRHTAECTYAPPQPCSPSCPARSPAPRRRLFASPKAARSSAADGTAAHSRAGDSRVADSREDDSRGASAAAQCSHGTPSRRADPYTPAPRSGYLSWDEYFMAVAFLSAQRSKDPNKQVGACIVNQDQVIVGIGYNGFPRGCADTALPWAKKSRTGNVLETKYPYVVHAEANALLNKNAAQVTGARIYVTMFPCNECAKLLIQAGIKEVVYHEAKAESSSHLPDTCRSALQDQAEDYAPGTGPAAMAAAEAGYIASKRLLLMAGVKLRQHTLQRGLMVVSA